MISLGSRDGRKGLEQGYSSNKREMDETELEEGEACSYQDDDDTSIDPEVALSYIDEKLQNVLGHFKKDFEGVVSAESLGAKFGIYGSFLPAHRRSPVNTHSRTPPRVQNHTTPQSPNTLQAEGGHQNPLAPANVSYTIKQGSASSGSFAYKPPPESDVCRMNANTKSIQSLEECTPKSEVRDHKTLKVRIKVGSENLSVKKNAAIYSGLGLDGSPTSSHDDSPIESEGLSCRLSFDGLESPTRILQMMTSSPFFGGCFLSPLPDDLMCLNERPKHLQNILVQPSPKVKVENSVKGQTSVKDNKTISGETNKMLLDKKGLLLQDKRDGKDSFRSPFHSKETDIDAVSYEELVSNALKLPLLSNTPNNLRGSPKASLKERVSGDVSKREPFETAFVHVRSSEKSNEKATLAGKYIRYKTAKVRKDMMADSEKVGDGKSETADSATNSNINSNIIMSSKIGLKDPVNHRTDTSTSHDNGIVLPCGNEHFSSEDEKRPKKSQEHGFASRKITMEIDKPAQVLKDRKYTDAEEFACRDEVQKESNRARGQYADFFGEMNELDGDILDSPIVPAGEMLKPSEVGGKTTLAYENTTWERTSSLETHKGSTSREKLGGPFNIASLQEYSQPVSEPASVAAIEDDNWVQCDKCQKWRLFPPGSKVDNLPDKWDCSLMTWLPGRNRCSVSEEETNNFHAPPLGMTSANNLSSDVLINGKATDKVRKTSKSSFKDSPYRLPSSMKKKQSSEKGKTLKEAKDSSLVSGLTLQQQPKFSDIYLETAQEKEIEKHRTDCYSDGGHAKIANLKSRRESDQEFPRTSKKNKTRSKQSGDTDRAAAHDQGTEILGVSSSYGFGGGTAGKYHASNSEFCASQNSKDGMADLPSGFLDDSKFQVEALPSVGSVPANKSGSGNKKRKSDNFKDPPSSTPSLGKLMDDNDKSSRKKHRMSKSEGKESSLSKRNGKVEKKSKNVSHHRLASNGCFQKDLSFVNPIVAATSSSSKISGSLKVKCKFQEIKGSPVESVSSSPCRIPNSDKLTSGCKVIVNDNVQDAVKLETSRRCSTADDEGSGGQSGVIRKDLYPTSVLHGSPNNDMLDKSKFGLHLTNGNSCIDNGNLDKGYFSEAQTSRRCVNETTRGEVHLDANMSNSGKSWKNSPSLSKDKNQISKSNSGRGKVKKSAPYDNSLDFTSVYEERERDRKTNVDEKCGSNADKTENYALFHIKEPSFPNPEGRQENNERRSSKKCAVERSEDLVPISAKEKSRHIPRSDGEKNEKSNIMQPCQSKAIASTSDARPDGLLREPRPNKKADNHNGNHISSNQPISNGHRIKNQDAPSPLRRDSSSQAASSAIKEATNLKHLADRLKSSGSIESTGMYFDAALKFLHGASILESGKTENIKHADIVQSMQIYSSTAKLCQFCAHEFEKSKDMASAALAYKCVEVAFMRVIYSAHNNASRDRHELQTALQMIPPGESPSSSASDIDNLNNTTNGDKATQARSSSSPQLAANLVIAARNRPNFSRLLSFAQDVNSAMEASRRSRIAFATANGSMGQGDLKDGISSIKRALDFNFHDVDGLLRLVRLAKEAISR